MSDFRSTRAIGSGRLAARPKSRCIHLHPINVMFYDSPRLFTGFYPSKEDGRLFFRVVSPLDAFRGYPLGRGCPACLLDNRYTRGPESAFLSYLRSLPVRRPAPPVDSDRTVFTAIVEYLTQQRYPTHPRLKIPCRWKVTPTMVTTF